MQKPEQIEDDYFPRLYEDDGEDFRQQYKENYKQIDDDAAERRFRSEFRSIEEPKHEVFSAVKDAFHPDNGDGYRTGYEASFTNPLYEISPNPAKLLLTNTNWRNVHFCFVVCESSGEEYPAWANRVNEVYDIVKGHGDYLLEQVDEVGKDINHIQYVTCIPKEDLPDVDFRYVSRQAVPDNYCLWVVDNDYSPAPDEDNPPMVQLRMEAGTSNHSDLRDPLNDGVDYRKSINRDITIEIETPPLIALQEVLMALMTEQYGSKEEPREFDRDDFVETFIDLCEIGASGDEKREILRERASVLIEEAKSADILYSGDTERIKGPNDFRARYEGSGTKKLRKVIKKKFVRSRIPIQKSKVAYDMTKKEFEPENGLKTDFDNNDWEN